MKKGTGKRRVDRRRRMDEGEGGRKSEEKG